MGKLLGSILRFLFSWIDAIIIKLITVLYRLLSDLSELVLYSDNIIKLIGRRIGLILGIFMLFKLAISLINYMISPDKLSDKSKGGGRLIINVGISLALLISINFIFKEAYKIQGVIVNSRIIEKIFFGEKGLVKSNNDYSEDSNNPSEKMDLGYYLYSSFFIPNNDIDVFGDVCDDMWDLTVDWKERKDDLNKSCYQTLEDKLDGEMMKSLGNARNSLDMSYVFTDPDLVLASPSAHKFYFNYTPIVSTAAGVIVLLVLLSFSMDLATRAVKLLFLQIIAPIPIISNMDMGKGQDIFKKWGKECINTYLSVFIRLIAINFAVFMIVLLKGNYGSLFTNNVWLNIFLIIGCLMFAKQVPGLIEEFLGIKLNGMALHPLKKFQEQALFGKQITGFAGAGLAAGAAFGANTIANHGNIFSGLAGAGSALARGSVGALKGQTFGQVYKGAYGGAITARNNRDSRQKLDISAPEVWLNSWQRRLGMDTTAESQDAHIKVYDEFSGSADALISLSESEVQKYASKISFGSGSLGRVGDNGATARDIATLTAAGINSSTFSTLSELREAMSDDTYSPQVRAALNAEYERLKGDSETLYRTRAINGSAGLNSSAEFGFIDASDTSGQTAMAHIKNLSEIYTTNKDDAAFSGFTSITGANVKSVNKQVKLKSTNIKNSDEYRKAHKVQEQTNREKK